MRIIRIVAIVLGVWVLLGLSLAAGIGYFQPRGPDTVVLRTFDATGQAHETVLRVREDNGQLYMKAKKFDRDFDAGKDVTSALNVSMARRGKQAQKRVNVDFPVWMIEELDNEAQRLGVTRQSIIKVWLAERLERLSSNSATNELR